MKDDINLDKLNSKDIKSNEQLKLHSIDQQLESKPIERALHLISFGEEVQKLSIIQAIPELLQVDRTGCLQKIVPKMQQALVTGSTEVHVTASLAVRAIIEDNVVPVEMFVRHFLHTITQAMDSRDPAVATSWSDTLLEAIKVLPNNIIQSEITPIALARAQLVRPVSTRVSSCKLLGELSLKYDAQTLKKDLIPTINSLCQDVNGEVRAEMAKQLVKVALKLGPELIKSSITQALIELSSDDNPLVKENTFITIVETLPYFQQESLKSTIIPLLKQMIVLAFKLDDNLLMTISKYFGQMCVGVGKFISEQEKEIYFKWYATLAVIGVTQSRRDSKTERKSEDQEMDSGPNHRHSTCRQYCAENFPIMVKFCQQQESVKRGSFDFLHSTFKLLVNDPCYMVRKSIAGVFHEVCQVYWKGCRDLKEEFLALCRDDSVDVLDGILPNISSILDIFLHNEIIKANYTDEAMTGILRTFLKTESTLSLKGHRWRSILIFVQQTRNFYKFVPSDLLYNTLILSFMKILQMSRIVPVRLATMKNLLLFMRHTTRPQHRKEIKDKILSDYCLSNSFYDRIIFVRMIPTIMELFSTNYYKENFFISTMRLLEDPVPNIRCSVVSYLPQLKAMLKIPTDNKLQSMLDSTLASLEDDQDRETKRVYLSIKEALNEANIQTLFPDDQRKYEEERKMFYEKRDDGGQKGRTPRPHPKKKPVTGPAPQTSQTTNNISKPSGPTTTPPGTTLRPPGRPPPARPRNLGRQGEREMTGQEKEFYVDAGVHLPYGIQQISINSTNISNNVNNNSNTKNNNNNNKNNNHHKNNNNNTATLKRRDNSRRIPVRRPNNQRHSLQFTDYNKNITSNEMAKPLRSPTFRNNNHRSHLPRPLSCINFHTDSTNNDDSPNTGNSSTASTSPSKQRHISRLPVVNRNGTENGKATRKS